MTLEEAINHAAGSLPGGAEITITVETGAGFVTACDWDGNWREDFDPADMTLAEQVLDCLDWCRKQPGPNAKLTCPPRGQQE